MCSVPGWESSLRWSRAGPDGKAGGEREGAEAAESKPVGQEAAVGLPGPDPGSRSESKPQQLLSPHYPLQFFCKSKMRGLPPC